MTFIQSTMMSCLWILVFGSLIAMQGGKVEASEDDGANTEVPSLPEEGGAAPNIEGETFSPEEVSTTPPEDGGAETESPLPAKEQDLAPDIVNTDAPSVVGEDQEPTAEPEAEEKSTVAELDSDTTSETVEEEPADTKDESSVTTLFTTVSSETLEPEDQAVDSDITMVEVPSIHAEAPAEENQAEAEQDPNTVDDNQVESVVDADGPYDGVGKARSAGAKAGPNDPEEPQGSGSGTVAGVVGAIGVAIVGAVSGFFAYQKKKLCFKASERDPERAKEEGGAQNDPQVLSNLLSSS